MPELAVTGMVYSVVNLIMEIRGRGDIQERDTFKDSPRTA